MKTYRNLHTNQYIANGLPEFADYKIYTHLEVIEYFNNYQKHIASSKLRHEASADISFKAHPEKKHHTIYKKFPENELKYPVDVNKKFSRSEGIFKETKGSWRTTRIVREDLIRNYKNPSYFFYFKIPYKFLQDYLVSNLCKTDLPKFYKVFKDVDLNKYSNIVTAFEHGDKVYPEEQVLNKPGGVVHTRKEWRIDMFPDMLYTMNVYGLGYPIINNNHHTLLYDGSHRLSCCPLTKTDYPVLQYCNAKDLQNNKAYLLTPKFFKNNTHLLLEVDIKQKATHGWLVANDLIEPYLKIKSNTEHSLVVTDRLNLDKVINKVTETPYEFRFK